MIESARIQRPLNDETLSEYDEQRFHAQRLEAIGRLAGGVAHDFNNLLTAIIGYSDLLLRELEDKSARKKVEEIKKAGVRATSLTRQLLAFSRTQILQPVVLDLNAVVRDLSGILQRLIGEDIELLTLANATEGRILADPTQIEQVIMNLIANARDAMPLGGKLTLETAQVYLDSEYASRHVSVRPGHYVMLAVTDTGTGMDAETQEKIFEPFFTTKERGRGTGLGLAAVYGVVKQLGGNIWVYSELCGGTTFKLYFPRCCEPITEVAKTSHSVISTHREATVLLVEDDQSVRDLIAEMLTDEGYHVLAAATGREALRICEDYDAQIDLMLTDVVMPDMSGVELVRQCLAKKHAMPVLYMSGYTDETVVRHGILDRNVEFIQKPFTPGDLANNLGRILDEYEAQ